MINEKEFLQIAWQTERVISMIQRIEESLKIHDPATPEMVLYAYKHCEEIENHIQKLFSIISRFPDLVSKKFASFPNIESFQHNKDYFCKGLSFIHEAPDSRFVQDAVTRVFYAGALMVAFIQLMQNIIDDGGKSNNHEPLKIESLEMKREPEKKTLNINEYDELEKKTYEFYGLFCEAEIRSDKTIEIQKFKDAFDHMETLQKRLNHAHRVIAKLVEKVDL